MSTEQKKGSRARARAPRKPLAPGRGKYVRGRSAQERLAEQRMRLLQAACEVFATQGYVRATVESIVTRAGMSRRTFYEHFADTRDVLLQLHEQAADDAFALVRARLDAEEDPVAKLRAAVTGFLEALAEQADLARVLFREVHAAGPELGARREAVIERFARLMKEGVEEAHAMGVVSRAPDDTTVFALVAALEAVAMRYVAREEEHRAVEAAPALIELVYRAFR